MPFTHRVVRTLAPAAVLLVFASTLTVSAADWPQWRGPTRDGVSTETDWSSIGVAENLWSASVGLGYSSFVVSDGRLYTMGFNEEEQVDTVFCLNATTGRPVWSHSYQAKIWNRMHTGGTLTTPSVDGDAVYTLNREGQLLRFKADDGEVLWSRDLVKEFSVTPPTWGFSASPLVIDDILVLNVGVVIALDTNTGKTIWKTRDLGHAYSTPATIELDDRGCLAVFNGSGMALLDRKTGEELSLHEWETKYEINAATPVIIGEKAFISSGYNRGCAMIKCSPNGLAVLWESKVMRTQMSGCVMVGEHLYGFDDAILKCIDLEGNEKWRARGIGKGSLMAAGGRLILIGSKGELIIAAADPGEYNELSRTKCLSGGVYWTMPVLVDGLIYCRSSEGSIVCRDHRPQPSADADTE